MHYFEKSCKFHPSFYSQWCSKQGVEGQQALGTRESSNSEAAILTPVRPAEVLAQELCWPGWGCCRSAIRHFCATAGGVRPVHSHVPASQRHHRSRERGSCVGLERFGLGPQPLHRHFPSDPFALTLPVKCEFFSCLPDCHKCPFLPRPPRCLHSGKCKPCSLSVTVV